MQVCGCQPALAVKLEHVGWQSICVQEVWELVDEPFWLNNRFQAVNLYSKTEWHLKEGHLLQKRSASCDDG